MSRPVYEPTTQRQIRRLGFSADQLFRRPAPASSGVMPVVYCEIDDQTFEDGNKYALTFLLGEFYLGSWFGAATSINLVNDDGTFIVGPSGDPEGLWVMTHGLYAYDAGVNFHSVGGLPVANAQMWFEFGPARLPVSINDPIADVVESIVTSSGENELTLRISGIVLLQPSPTSPSESANGVALSVIVDGADLDISQGWFTMTKLTDVDV